MCIHGTVTWADVGLLHILKLPHLLSSLKEVATGSLHVLNRVPKFGCCSPYNPCILRPPKYKVTNLSCVIKQMKTNIKTKPLWRKEAKSGWKIISGTTTLLKEIHVGLPKPYFPAQLPSRGFTFPPASGSQARRLFGADTAGKDEGRFSPSLPG